MSVHNIDLEITVVLDSVDICMINNDTGEIRQKTRSKEWLMRRLLGNELKTWKANDGFTPNLEEVICWNK